MSAKERSRSEFCADIQSFLIKCIFAIPSPNQLVILILLFFICPIAIAYSMGQIIKSVCVCQSVCLSVRLRALSRSHFLIDFHQNWYRRENPQKEERVR